MFYAMTGIPIRLQGQGFLSCKLVNIDYLFANNTSNLTGSIPYGLFKMVASTRKAVYGWLEGNSEGIDESYGTTWETVQFPNGSEEDMYVYDPKVPDVSATRQEYLSNDLGTSIKKASYVFYNIQAPNEQNTPYVLDRDEITATRPGILLEENYAYNPIKYILNPSFCVDGL